MLPLPDVAPVTPPVIVPIVQLKVAPAGDDVNGILDAIPLHPN